LERLQTIADSLWLVEGAIVDFYGFPYPTRMVIARCEGGALWVWSPVKLSAGLRADVDALGRVAHLVSPNKLHHLYLAEWKRAYPDAMLWGPASTIKRHDDLAFGPPLRDAPPREWGPDLDQAWFHGSFAMDEIVFFHRPSRTAIFADLIEAFSDTFLEKHWSWWQRPLARLDGITAHCPHAPLEWRLSFIKRAAARAARAKVLAWAPERAIMAHGDWCRTGGSAYVERALSWLAPDGRS
jgi:hypothetical protein